jgi:hypothetical protein
MKPAKSISEVIHKFNSQSRYVWEKRFEVLHIDGSMWPDEHSLGGSSSWDVVIILQQVIPQMVTKMLKFGQFLDGINERNECNEAGVRVT